MAGERVQRVAAYAVIVRDGQILLSMLSPRLTRDEMWTLPGGGIDHGEDPRDAVVREVYEETGLPLTIGESARTFNLHLPDSWRDGRRADAHSLRIVYDGYVPVDSPPPRVIEVDGSTVDAAWHPLAAVLSRSVPTVKLVREALASYRPHPQQRLAAYALLRRGEDVLLTLISSRGHHTGSWTLPGGGVDHGERPQDALIREVREECGLDCTVGQVLAVDDLVVRGNAPDGRDEDFHAVHLVFSATVPEGSQPRVLEVDGTTEDVAWVPVAEILDGSRPVLDVVRAALSAEFALPTGQRE